MTNTNHTISSGLRRCKAIAGELALLDAHLVTSTIYNEGQEPTYSFAEVMEKRSALIKELTDLRSRIAVANAITRCGEATLVYAVQELSQLKSEISKVRSLNCAPKERTENTSWETDWENIGEVAGFGRSAPKKKVVTITICTFTERQRDEQVAKLQERFSALNAQVEHLNHITRLV